MTLATCYRAPNYAAGDYIKMLHDYLLANIYPATRNNTRTFFIDNRSAMVRNAADNDNRDSKKRITPQQHVCLMQVGVCLTVGPPKKLT